MVILTVLTSILSRYTLNNNNKYMLTLTVLTSKVYRYTLNNNNKYLLKLTVLTSMLSRYTHRRSWHGLTTPFFLTFCLQIYFQ